MDPFFLFICIEDGIGSTYNICKLFRYAMLCIWKQNYIDITLIYILIPILFLPKPTSQVYKGWPPNLLCMLNSAVIVCCKMLLLLSELQTG